MGVPGNLKSLDELDHAIWDLKQTIDQLKLKADSLQQKSKELTLNQETVAAASLKLELEVREIESKSHQLIADREKLKKQLLEATSVKMADVSKAKLLELEQHLSRCEEHWLEVSEHLEDSKLAVETSAREIDNHEKESSSEWDHLNRELMEAQSRLPELMDQRAGFLDGLESTIADLYESRRKTDPFQLRIFELEDENCPNCQMQLTYQLFERVRYANEIQKCPSCGVIIYWGS